MKIVNQTVVVLDGITMVLSDDRVGLVQSAFMFSGNQEVSLDHETFHKIAAIVYGRQQLKEAASNVVEKKGTVINYRKYTSGSSESNLGSGGGIV